MELTHYLSKRELNSLDKDRLKEHLSDRLVLNRLLGRPVNYKLLNEIRLVIEGKPIPKQKSKNGPVRKFQSHE